MSEASFELRRKLRKVVYWSHRWIGLLGGVFICLLAISGGIVTFRPQIANLLSPAAVTGNCVAQVDWNQAEREIEAFGHSKINRVYAPAAPETRYRFRMMTAQNSIFDHLIYDGCAGKVTGTANLGWMDWLVDFHHNLRAEKAGRTAAGWIGLLLFLSSLGGLLLWLLSKPGVMRLLRIRGGLLMQKDLHTTTGLVSVLLLLTASFTSMWLCFPQTMRGGLAYFTSLPKDSRVPRAKKPGEETPLAGLGDIMKAAETKIPDGSIREIRLPEGYGNVQVRMWREGDFRSLGNNVVTVDRATATVMATNLYETKPTGDRVVQAMAGMHYGEWGGLLFRSLYGLAGFGAGLLFVTGFLLWWLPKRLAAARASKTPARDAVTAAA